MSRRLTQEEILMPDVTLIFTPHQWKQLSEEAKEALVGATLNKKQVIEQVQEYFSHRTERDRYVE